MPTTIYLVTSGCYSDYHEVGGFSSKEKAQQYIANNNSHLDEPRIKPIIIDELETPNKKLFFVATGCAKVTMSISNKPQLRAPYLQVDVVKSYATETIITVPVPSVSKICINRTYGEITVWSAKGKEHAHKLCVETLQKEKATKILGIEEFFIGEDGVISQRQDSDD